MMLILDVRERVFWAKKRKNSICNEPANLYLSIGSRRSKYAKPTIVLLHKVIASAH